MKFKRNKDEERIQKCMKNVGVGYEEAEQILERIDLVLSGLYLAG